MGRHDAGPTEADNRPRRAPGSHHAARGPAPRPLPGSRAQPCLHPHAVAPRPANCTKGLRVHVCVISVRASNFTFETLTFKF